MRGILKNQTAQKKTRERLGMELLAGVHSQGASFSTKPGGRGWRFYRNLGFGGSGYSSLPLFTGDDST